MFLAMLEIFDFIQR